MLITRTTRARRKLNLSPTTVRLLSGPGLGERVCVGPHSVSCELPEDQTKNNCTSPAHLESIAVSVGPETQCCSAPAPVPRP